MKFTSFFISLASFAPQKTPWIKCEIRLQIEGSESFICEVAKRKLGAIYSILKPTADVVYFFP